MQEIKQALKDYEIVLNEMIQRFLQLEKSINVEKQADEKNNTNHLVQFEQLKNSLTQLKQYHEQSSHEEKFQIISNYQHELLNKFDNLQQSFSKDMKVKKSTIIDFYKVSIAAVLLLCLIILGILMAKPKLCEARSILTNESSSPEAVKYAFIKSLPQTSLKKVITAVDTLYVKQGPSAMQKETEKNLKKQKVSINL